MDTIGDFLAAIKNAQGRFHERVEVPSSRMKVEVARVLKEEGFIAGYRHIPDRKQGILRVQLRYTPDRKYILQGLKRVSKPGLRIYKGWRELVRVRGGLGVSVVSTSQGLMSDKKCRKERLGGEVLADLW